MEFNQFNILCTDSKGLGPWWTLGLSFFKTFLWEKLSCTQIYICKIWCKGNMNFKEYVYYLRNCY